MKSLNKLITAAVFILAIGTLSAQTPPPPNGDGSNPTGGGNTPVGGGGAPIGSGLFILLGLGAGYGIKKVFELKKRKLKE